MTELRPKRSSFLFQRVSGAVIGSTVLALALAGVGFAADLGPLKLAALALWLFLVGWSVFGASVAWRKERYEVHDGHLVAHGGGLVSDWTQELDLRNVTHVKQHLHWIRYRFFDVGDVIVQSAGSASAEVVFRSVVDPDGLVERLRQSLRDNGFSLQASELRLRESPSTLGAVVECASIAAGFVFFVAWFGAGALVEDQPLMQFLALVGGGLAAGGLSVFLVLHFLDLKRRTYEVHDDVVEYREGFLSRTNAFIPFENIADASTKQTFLDQILGLYDVKVSCQGSGSEIGFRRLARGPAMQQAVRGLVEANQGLRELEAQAAAEVAGPAEGTSSRATRPAAQAVPADQAWTSELRMNVARAFFGTGILRAIGTRYTVGASSVASRYKLIGQQQLEFAYDKVTGVQQRTSPLDGIFGTTTVRVWSIGSSLPVDLKHVTRSRLDLPALLRQCGIPGGEAQLSLPTGLTPQVWLRAHLGTVVLLAVLGLFPLLLVPLLFATARWRAGHQHLTLHEHHVELRSGVFWRRHTWARYDDLKKVQVLRYYGSEAGRLTLFVAGETARQTKKGAAGPPMQNRLTAHYLPSAGPLAHTLDPLLLGRLTPDRALEGSAAAPDGEAFVPAVANALVPLLLFPPLWLLIPWRWLSVKRRSYRVEADRAVIEHGVLYRTHTSVLFDRIDSLNQGQGLLGKTFGNGSVTLLTAGSSRPDLVLSHTPGYTALYAAIRARYGR